MRTITNATVDNHEFIVMVTDAGAEASLAFADSKARSRVDARRLATLAANAMISLGFISGTQAMATTPECTIRGRHLPEVPADFAEAIDCAWEILTDVLNQSMPEDFATGQDDRRMAIGSILDSALDIAILTGSFVRQR